jgi:hypothetical protein
MTGSTLCWPLSDNQREIHLMGTHLDGEYIFGVEWFGEQAGPYLKPGTPVIAVTKGLVADGNGDLHIVPDAMKRGHCGRRLAG